MRDGFSRLDQRIDSLEQKVDEGFAGIAEAIEGINEHQAEQGGRLDKLEAASA